MIGIDFIKVTKHFDCKVTNNSVNIQQNLTETGESLFKVFYDMKGYGNTSIKVWFDKDGYSMGIEGSLMYYWQGHNLTFCLVDFVNAINDIGERLNIDLWDAFVETFEFGTIMDVEQEPQEYIKHHSASKKQHLNKRSNEDYKNLFVMWRDKKGLIDLKMYCPEVNSKSKVRKATRNLLQETGLFDFNKHHIKWEIRYHKPDTLNKGVALKLNELISPEWLDFLCGELYSQYKRLTPAESIEYPQNKKQLTTADIIIRVLALHCNQDGYSIEDITNALIDYVKSIPNILLNSEDKKSRKRQLKRQTSKLKPSGVSTWDLSACLEKTLQEQLLY